MSMVRNDVTPEHFSIRKLANDEIVEFGLNGNVKFIGTHPIDIQSRLSYFNLN